MPAHYYGGCNRAQVPAAAAPAPPRLASPPPPEAPSMTPQTHAAIAGGVGGGAALLALVAVAVHFVLRRQRLSRKGGGLPTLASGAYGDTGTSGSGAAAADKDSAFAWPPLQRTLLPASSANSQQTSSRGLSLHVSVGTAEAAAAALAAAEDRVLSERLVDQQLRPEDIVFAEGVDGKPHLLGKGAFGEVYLARWNYTEVAVKVLHVGENIRQQEEFRREAELLRALRHPNVVMYLGSCLVPGQQNMVVMEFAAGGTLSSKLATDGLAGQPRRFGWYGRGRMIAHGVATGLAYLHASHIIHFDIKSSNVLLDRAGLTAKIADVGLSKIARGSEVSQTMRGTESYLAPELYGYGSEKCTNKVDVYSFGVLLAEIITGEPPSKRFGLREPIVPDECPQEAVDLYRRCIDRDPLARPTALMVRRGQLTG
ncbi:hypothetical protein WJX81_008198 [Elliptochloris bilobata]|uniref:Protein kinase domain-containing protein n=1 Tax=Elliptochloris bilobata TaxID=381761 RepID=A0AAW1SBF6_9CHLO